MSGFEELPAPEVIEKILEAVTVSTTDEAIADFVVELEGLGVDERRSAALFAKRHVTLLRTLRATGSRAWMGKRSLMMAAAGLALVAGIGLWHPWKAAPAGPALPAAGTLPLPNMRTPPKDWSRLELVTFVLSDLQTSGDIMAAVFDRCGELELVEAIPKAALYASATPKSPTGRTRPEVPAAINFLRKFPMPRIEEEIQRWASRFTDPADVIRKLRRVIAG